MRKAIGAHEMRELGKQHFSCQSWFTGRVLRFDERLPDVGGVCPVVTWYCEDFSQPYEEGGNNSQDGERNSKYEERKYGGKGTCSAIRGL